jgi:hypothetical protein
MLRFEDIFWWIFEGILKGNKRVFRTAAKVIPTIQRLCRLVRRRLDERKKIVLRFWYLW